jgi:hypothetical protein
VYSGVNNLETKTLNIYRHNSKTLKGTFYGTKYESYFEVIFNQRLDVTKLYQSIIWVTTVLNSNEGVEQFETINKIVVYNDNQNSGVIDLSTSGLNPIRGRNNEWYFNKFENMVINANSPTIDDKGAIITNNINTNKIWFEKSYFISKFIVVRLIIDNISNNTIHVHRVNVKSVINK